MAGPGLFQCYGLFWDVDKVVWSGAEFRLLGRRGAQGDGLEVCDFRNQVGLYVLHDDYGTYYVGLTRSQPLGKRLRDHLDDHHRGLWDRFSWFGFRRVRRLRYIDRTQALAKLPKNLVTDSRETIADVEALLIQTLGTHRRGNKTQPKFGLAERWEQILKDEREKYLERVQWKRASLPRENRHAFAEAIRGTKMPR
jgi:hypothetical protein